MWGGPAVTGPASPHATSMPKSAVHSHPRQFWAIGVNLSILAMALHELSVGSRGPVAVGSALGASPVGGTPRSSAGGASRASLSGFGLPFPSSASLDGRSVDDYWDAQSIGGAPAPGAARFRAAPKEGTLP